MFPYEDSKTVSVCPSVCLSVCPHPEKRYRHSFVNISPTLVIDTSMERSSRVLHHGNPKIWIFFQKSSKFEICLLTKSWNHLSFVNISSTLVIDTSMGRFSRVLHHGNPKIWFFFQKSSKFEFWLLTKSWNHLSFVNISPTLVIDTLMERSSRVLQYGNPKTGFFFQKSSKFEFWLLTKSWNPLSFVNISPTIVIDTSMERSSRVLHHGNPEMWKFFKKFEIEFCPYPEFPYAEKKNRPGFVNFQSYITNWYVNGKVFTSTTTWEPKKKRIFFKKMFEIEFDLYFDLCWRAEIIQVGLNMHLYDDIGDASSSLWGSTSSCLWVSRNKLYLLYHGLPWEWIFLILPFFIWKA